MENFNSDKCDHFSQTMRRFYNTELLFNYGQIFPGIMKYPEITRSTDPTIMWDIDIFPSRFHPIRTCVRVGFFANKVTDGDRQSRLNALPKDNPPLGDV